MSERNQPLRSEELEALAQKLVAGIEAHEGQHFEIILDLPQMMALCGLARFALDHPQLRGSAVERTIRPVLDTIVANSREAGISEVVCEALELGMMPVVLRMQVLPQVPGGAQA